METAKKAIKPDQRKQIEKMLASRLEDMDDLITKVFNKLGPLNIDHVTMVLKAIGLRKAAFNSDVTEYSRVTDRFGRVLEGQYDLTSRRPAGIIRESSNEAD